MIKLTDKQITEITEAGFGGVVIANSYTDFCTIKLLGKDDFNKVLPMVGMLGNWDTYLASGNLQDLPKFIEFLKTSPVLVVALRTSHTNETVRKLVFELLGWLTNGVGEKSPYSILGCWNELNRVTKGAIKGLAGAEAVAEWNKAIDACLMLPGFKL